jgi:hypothetical protein
VNQQSKTSPALARLKLNRIMAFVANNDSNDLLVCTATLLSNPDGLVGLDHHLVHQQSKTAPALANLNETLVLVFVANNASNDLLVCASTDGVNWSANHRVNQQSKSAPAPGRIPKQADPCICGQ